jgi:hypothetical protein
MKEGTNLIKVSRYYFLFVYPAAMNLQTQNLFYRELILLRISRPNIIESSEIHSPDFEFTNKMK